MTKTLVTRIMKTLVTRIMVIYLFRKKIMLSTMEVFFHMNIQVKSLVIVIFYTVHAFWPPMKNIELTNLIERRFKRETGL